VQVPEERIAQEVVLMVERGLTLDQIRSELISRGKKKDLQ